jgi:tellurite resistance protein
MSMTDKNEIYEAIVAAFCLVSYADGELHQAELSRFIGLMQEDADFRHLDLDKLLLDIELEITLLDKDFKKGKDKSLAKIQMVKNDFRTMERVIRVARIALIADGRIHMSEEVQLSDIHRALGLGDEQ